MTTSERQYECVIFGATGYTGKYTAEHITTHLPGDFRWAIAGRSEVKLKTLAGELGNLHADRLQPGIEVVKLEKDELLTLAKKTKVLATTVGPYHKYGSVVFEACAETGTHYLDITGEIPWVYDMVQKYHETAKRTGAIMIPQDGVESAPADLMCWMLASHIRKTLGVGTGEVIHTLYDAKASVSGGTLSTVLTLLDAYSLSYLNHSGQPWALCPIEPPMTDFPKPDFEKWTGLRTVSDLGLLTDNIQGAADIPIIGRSWGLHEKGKLYGSNFRVTCYMRTHNFLTGFGVHVAYLVGFIALLLPPVRWALQRLVYQPGDGPTREQAKNQFMEWRAIANADVTDPNDPKRVYGRMRWSGGGPYRLTGVCLAESALLLARGETEAHKAKGGVLTPSTLGEAYLERLQKAGMTIEMKTLPR